MDLSNPDQKSNFIPVDKSQPVVEVQPVVEEAVQPLPTLDGTIFNGTAFDLSAFVDADSSMFTSISLPVLICISLH